jgi:hypothetical protein
MEYNAHAHPCTDCGLRACLSGGGGNAFERNGMLPERWGAPLWYTLHTMAFNFPLPPPKPDRQAAGFQKAALEFPAKLADFRRRRQGYHELLDALRYTLPCCCCRDNYAVHVDALLNDPEWKDAFASRDRFSRFVFALHNRVNAKLGKPAFENFNRVRRVYESGRVGHEQCAGRALVVVVPPAADDGKESIRVNSACVLGQ